MDEETFTFSWDVKNFSLCPQKARYYLEQRGNFVVRMLNETAWRGCLFYQRAHNGTDFISFYLMRCRDKGPYSIGLRATFQLIAADGTPGKEITKTENIRITRGFDFEKFVSRSDVEKLYLHKDTLKIQCILRKTNKELTTRSLFAHTSGYVQKICKEWALTNFSQLRQGIVLKEFVRLQEGELLLNVCLSIEGRPGQKVVIIQFTRRCDPKRKPLSLNTLITILDAQGINSNIWKQDHHVFHMRTPEEIWQFPTFINKASLVRQKNKYLANDVLKLKCDIAISLGTMTSEIEKTSFSVEKSDTHSVNKLTEDMKDLFNSKQFADVKLRVCGETVPAHRFILQSRSKKFAQMLVDIEETDNVVLDVPDVAMITLKRMLKYMYTDEIDDLEYDDAAAAYIAAHKYRIESLKCKYSFVLQSHLKLSNACNILILADDSCDNSLKNCVVEFIKQYWCQVCLSGEWEELSMERKLLAQKTKEQIRRMYAFKHSTKYL